MTTPTLEVCGSIVGTSNSTNHFTRRMELETIPTSSHCESCRWSFQVSKLKSRCKSCKRSKSRFSFFSHNHIGPSQSCSLLLTLEWCLYFEQLAYQFLLAIGLTSCISSNRTQHLRRAVMDHCQVFHWNPLVAFRKLNILQLLGV